MKNLQKFLRSLRRNSGKLGELVLRLLRPTHFGRMVNFRQSSLTREGKLEQWLGHSALEKVGHDTKGKGEYTLREVFASLGSVPVTLRDRDDPIPLKSCFSLLTDREVVMRVAPEPQAEAALQQLAEQFSHWRQSRPTPYGPRIPEALWTEALRLVRHLPLTRVAKALRLKPHTLKRRSGITTTPATPPTRELPFVEVSLGARRASTIEVEIQRLDGTRLRITYGDTAPALGSLVQAFLEPR